MLEGITYPWKLRLSKRAKRPRLTINAYGHVELVWPERMPKKHMSSMLREHQPWVLKHLSNLTPSARISLKLPDEVVFQAIEQEWFVNYKQNQSPQVRVLEKNGVLHISGNVDDKEKVRQALCRWVKKQAKQHLTYWLEDVASSMGLSYQSLTIRLQKKRWGSCSATKRINLNAALLFLPPQLVEHVLIHELMHLKHLNHSASFWAGVEKHDQDYKANRMLLRKHASDAPAWLTEPFVGVEADL